MLILKLYIYSAQFLVVQLLSMKLTDTKQEIIDLIKSIREMDRKVIIIFLTVAVIQTISWYYTSRNFFRHNIFSIYQNDPNVYLYEYLYWFIGDFFTLFILTSIVIKFVLREKLSDFGIQPGEIKAGLIFSSLFLGVMIILIWFFSATISFSEKYPHLLSTRNDWNAFSIYEMGMLIYMISWEFIWRGFMLFGLKEKFGYYSVLIQMIPFVILHNGKPIAETFGAIGGGIALGILAFRTNSIFYCVVTHAGVMFTIDLLSTLRYRANDYGVGLDSLINIIKTFF